MTLAALIGAILILNPLVKAEKANKIAQDVMQYCIPSARNAFIAIMSVESNFVTHKISHTGDYGLAQVNLKAWGAFYGVSRDQLLDPKTNVRIGCSILNLKYIKHKAHEDWPAYYHSRKEKPRLRYWKKVKIALERISR